MSKIRTYELNAHQPLRFKVHKLLKREMTVLIYIYGDVYSLLKRNAAGNIIEHEVGGGGCHWCSCLLCVSLGLAGRAQDLPS